MGGYKESGRQTSPVFVTVILAASVPLIFGLSLPITSDVEKSELIDVDIIEDTPRIRHKRDNSHLELPETTQIRLKINDDQVTLSLMRNAKLNINTPVYVVRNGQVIQDLLPQVQGRALYHDIRNGASFLLTRHYEGANRGNLSLFGTFQAHSRHYVIQPNDDFDTTGSEEKRHTLSSMAPQTLYFDGILPKTATWKLNATRMHTRSRTKRQTKQYAIEVFAVIDYAVYDFFYKRASKSTTTAKQNIREYYTFVLNAMDARYKTISKEDFVMDILSAGIFIAEYPSAAPWTENHKSFGSPVYRVDSNSTLDAFTAWVDNQPNLPKRDHTMGFTAYNITSDKGQRDSAGIAFQGGITRTGGITVALCSDKSTSVIEESFNFISATTAAHELGHSLGSGHDDIQVNACSANDNYIMATSNEVTNTGTKGQNNWYFSSCSVSSFKSYIDYLDGFDINCMLTESDTSSFPTTDRPMAEAYPADKVCSLSLGVGSYVCRSIQDFNTLCASMFCNKPNTTQCYTVIPAEGTPCGKGKWCDKGACVTSSRAPIDVTDDCPLGNRPGVFDNTGKTCEQHIADDPGHCYGKYTLANCCASCQANKRNVKDCEYGDKFIGCEATNCDRYDSKSKAGCCETCADSSQTLAPVTTTSTQAPTTTPTTTKRKTQTTKSSTERFTPSRTTSQLTDPTTTSVMEVTTENTGTSNLLIVGLGAGVGSLVVVVIVVVICVVLRKKRSAASQGASKPSKNNPYDNIGFVTNDRPNHPPPRRGSNSSFQPHSAIHTSNAPQISIVANGTRESVDGYMLPASVKLQEINNGVHYTAPNKPKPNGARNLPLQTFHNRNNMADQQKRISKPIHYKKTGMPVNGNTNKTAANANDITSHASGNGPPPYPQRKVSDAYDSIGDLQSVSNTNYNKDRRPTLPENHPRSLLRGDLRLGQPNAISMNTTNNNSVSKPSNNFQQYGQRHVAMVPPNRNKFNPQENTSDKINHQTPMEAPTPRPRNRLPSNNEVQKRADNSRVHNDDVVNTYDSANSTVKETNNRFPMKPPVKPVPRRQELSSIGSDSRNHQETTQLDNAQQNANTHADVNEENMLREPYKKLPLKPPTKPVPRRQNMFTESGKSNDAFRVDELEIQI